MSNFQTPFQKGADLILPGVIAPCTVRVTGVDVNSQYGEEVLNYYQGVIRQFQATMAQNYALSSVPMMSKRVEINPEITLSYDNQWGKEFITAEITPPPGAATGQRTRPLFIPKSFTPESKDWIYDGCIIFRNFNAVRDDDFEIFLNNQYIGDVVMNDDLDRATVFYFHAGDPQFAKKLDQPRKTIPTPEEAGRTGPEWTFKYWGLEHIYEDVAEVTEHFIKIDPFSGDLINYKGSNTLEMRRVRDNGAGNLGAVWVGFFDQDEKYARKVVKGPTRAIREPGQILTTNDKPISFDFQYEDFTAEIFTFEFAFDGSTPDSLSPQTSWIDDAGYYEFMGLV